MNKHRLHAFNFTYTLLENYINKQKIMQIINLRKNIIFNKKLHIKGVFVLSISRFILASDVALLIQLIDVALLIQLIDVALLIQLIVVALLIQLIDVALLIQLIDVALLIQLIVGCPCDRLMYL